MMKGLTFTTSLHQHLVTCSAEKTNTSSFKFLGERKREKGRHTEDLFKNSRELRTGRPPGRIPCPITTQVFKRFLGIFQKKNNNRYFTPEVES